MTLSGVVDGWKNLSKMMEWSFLPYSRIILEVVHRSGQRTAASRCGEAWFTNDYILTEEPEVFLGLLGM